MLKPALENDSRDRSLTVAALLAIGAARVSEPVRLLSALLACVVLAASALAQNATSGFSIPVTVSGGAMYTGRLQLRDPDASPAAAGARTMFYPSLTLGEHWFGYAAVQVRWAPYFYYDAFVPGRGIETDVIQAFAGYSIRTEKTAVVVKAGRLPSAFGAFPLHYDDADDPVLDQPFSYMTELPLSAAQIPCGTADLRKQFYGSVSNACGGASSRSPGLTPATLYGIDGIEADLAASRFDARLQLTSGSPANPEGFSDVGKYLQWIAGAGYSIRPGLRVGISGFRGPYLDPNVASFLPPGTGLRDFPASAIGFDAQWKHGRWSAAGEWQRFWFDSPNFAVAPSIQSGYGELKAVITPRLFLAGRAGWLDPGSVVDTSGIAASSFASGLRSYELGAGYWLGRNELLKGSYEWMHSVGSTGTRTNVFGAQLIVRFNSLAWAFR